MRFGIGNDKHKFVLCGCVLHLKNAGVGDFMFLSFFPFSLGICGHRKYNGKCQRIVWLFIRVLSSFQELCIKHIHYTNTQCTSDKSLFIFALHLCLHLCIWALCILSNWNQTCDIIFFLSFIFVGETAACNKLFLEAATTKTTATQRIARCRW